MTIPRTGNNLAGRGLQAREVRSAAGGQSIADLEALGQPELFQSADPRLEQGLLGADLRGEENQGCFGAEG